MATFFRTKIVNNIGTTPVDALVPTGTSKFTIIGCSLANTSSNDVVVNVIVIDASATAGYYVKHMFIPPNTSAKIITNGEKLIIAEECKLRIVSDTDSSIDAVISYAEIV